MKKIIMVIALILWGVFFYTQLKADELNCETFVKEEICKMTPAEQEAWFWELFKSLMEEEKQEIVETIEV
jgi:hypothetical protein